MSTADDDDERTLAGPPSAGSARAGARADAETGLQAERRRGRAAAEFQPGHTLPLGTRLRDYEITGLIGEGGFGIVYLAWDHSLQRRVAIKEYMPASMAARVNGSSAIVVKSERHLDTFRAGLKSFVNEARLLARFDHPSLVKVYRFWEENGTAYMVMPYYEGPTLKAALAELGRAPSEDELRAWLKPLLDALAVMHAAQCYHRDISPDNILLTPRGPLLLDFGAARRVIGDMTHAITVVLKPGYAPIEQYGDVATMAQGAWTDLYALACVVYYAIAGKTPMSSVERLMDDRIEPLGVAAAGRYGGAFLRAIDAALAVRPADRPQTVRQFRALLDADRPAQAAESERDSGAVPLMTAPGALAPLSEPPPVAPAADPRAFESTAARTVLATVPDAAPAASFAASTWSEPTTTAAPSASNELATSLESPPFESPSIEASPSSESPALAPAGARRSRAAMLLIGAAIVAVLATVALFAWQQRDAASAGAGDSPAAIAAPPAASFAATAPAPVASAAARTAVPEEPPAAVDAPAARPAAVIDASPARPAGADSPGLGPPATSTAPALVERAPAEVPASAETRIDRPRDAPPSSTALPVERATVDGDAASGVASAPARTARPRREAPPPARADTAAAAKPVAPRTPMVSARCSDILQKASLEPLTAAEADYLKRECR